MDKQVSTQNQLQWNANVNIIVSVKPADDRHDLNIGYRDNQAECTLIIPLTALPATNFTETIKAITAQALEKVRLAIIAQAEEKSAEN